MKISKICIPTIDYIIEVEKLFSVSYPITFKEFCNKYNNINILDEYPNLSKGKFITDLNELKIINSRIGNEQWGDYERAIAGKLHIKDGMKLWGEILPIYYNNDKDIFGFNYINQNDNKIYVWSVHCLVHNYSDIFTWLKAV